MPEINYKSLANHIEEKKFSPAYLVWGDEFLYKKAFNKLLEAMVPASLRNLNYEPLEGGNDNIDKAIEKVSTFSFMPGTKVVAICDSQVFYKTQSSEKLYEKAKNSCEKEDFKAGAKYFLNLLSSLNLSIDDMEKEKRGKNLKLKSGASANLDWMDDLISYCLEKELAVPQASDLSAPLREALKKGFPENNHLIITTDLADRRRGLYKSIKETGTVIDCSIPKGERWADKKELEAICREHVQKILKKNGRRANPEVLHKIVEMTGPSLRLLSNNLEKLIDWAGSREKITANDVDAVLRRTKNDPIYELTNAISEKNASKSLFYLDSLLSNDLHPLQALMAITNQMRKLIVAKGFMESPGCRSWKPGTSYSVFRNRVMPEIAAFDKEMAQTVKGWEEMLSGSAGSKTSGKKRTKSFASDFAVAKNPGNPYPVYRTMLGAEKFSKKELADSFDLLGMADSRMKSGSANLKLELEKVILAICL